MHFEVEELNPTEKRIQIVVPASRVNSVFSRVYKDIAAHASLPGFRAGHVPMSHLQKRYGQQATNEVSQDLINLAWKCMLDDAKVRPVGDPEVDAKPAQMGKDYTVTIKTSCLPEIELRDPHEIELERIDWKIADAAIDAEIDTLKKRFGTLIDVDDPETTAANGHTVMMDYAGSIYDVPFEGGTGKNEAIELGASSLLPGFEDQIIGHKVGDSFDIKIDFPKEYHAKNLAGKPAVFACKINAIKKLVPAEEGDAITKPLGARDMDQLRESIRDGLTARQAHATEEELRKNLRKKLGELYQIPVPAPFLADSVEEKRREKVRSLIQSGKSMEEADTEAKNATAELEAEALNEARAEMVIDAFADHENITVTDNEVRHRVNQMASTMGKYAAAIRNMYEDPARRAQIRRAMRHEKVIEFLVSKANITLIPRDAPFGQTESAEA